MRPRDGSESEPCVVQHGAGACSLGPSLTNAGIAERPTELHETTAFDQGGAYRITADAPFRPVVSCSFRLISPPPRVVSNPSISPATRDLRGGSAAPLSVRAPRQGAPRPHVRGLHKGSRARGCEAASRSSPYSQRRSWRGRRMVKGPTIKCGSGSVSARGSHLGLLDYRNLNLDIAHAQVAAIEHVEFQQARWFGCVCGRRFEANVCHTQHREGLRDGDMRQTSAGVVKRTEDISQPGFPAVFA